MKSSNHQKHLLFGTIPCLLIAMLFIVGGCNNDDKNSKPDNAGTSSEKPTTLAADAAEAADVDAEAERIVDKTYYMKLSADSLRAIFGPAGSNTIKRLNFEFRIHNKRFALRVYGSDSAGNNTTRMVPLEIISSKNPVRNPNQLIRHAQFITRGDLKAFLSIARGTNTPIDPARFRDMYFKASVEQHPRHPGRNYMYFFYADTLDKLEALRFDDGEGFTNPTPPGKPCEYGCDN